MYKHFRSSHPWQDKWQSKTTTCCAKQLTENFGMENFSEHPKGQLYTLEAQCTTKLFKEPKETHKFRIYKCTGSSKATSVKPSSHTLNKITDGVKQQW